MNSPQLSRCVVMSGWMGSVLLSWLGGPQEAFARAVTLSRGFTPNPMRLEGTGGGDRPAQAVVKTRQTPTGLCLGYVSLTPDEEITLSDRFANLKLSVESELDTTLIVQGPGGVWCSDDSQDSDDPMIAGEWLPGIYRVWIGAYRAGEVPDYDLYIDDQS